MPRSLKIWTEASERASEMRTRGAIGNILSLARGPGSPRWSGRANTVLPRIGSGCLGQCILSLGEGPVEPERERLDVGGLDGRAAPDAQAGGCVTIGVDIVGDAFLLERRGQVLDEARLRLGRQG